MSSCNPELVSAFLDGELDKVILSAVTDHLIACDSCCKLLSTLVQVRDGVSERFSLQDPETFTGLVMAAIANEKNVGMRARDPEEGNWRRFFMGMAQPGGEPRLRR